MAAATFKVVGMFQYRENYGCHTCQCKDDASCTCPNYWKNKGGESKILLDGITSEMMCVGTEDLLTMARKLAEQHEFRSRFATNELVDFEFLGLGDQTYEEKMNQDMVDWGYE